MGYNTSTIRMFIQILSFNIMAYIVIIRSFQLKTNKIRAYLLAIIYASFTSLGEVLALAHRGMVLYQQNKILYFAIQGCILLGVLLTVIFIRQIFTPAWYRIYWWYSMAGIILSLPIRVFYKGVILGDKVSEAFLTSLNMQGFLRYLLSFALSVGLGMLLIYIGKRMSVLNTLNYITKRYRYPIYLFSSLILWNIKQYIMTKSTITIRYEIGAYLIISIIILMIVVDLSNRNILKIENTILNQQKELISWEFDNMKQRELAIHKLYHDIGNHINTLHILIEDGEISHAEEYMQDILKRYQGIGDNVFCTNHIINSVLVQKRKLCEQNDINFRALLTLPEILPYRDIDIMSVFSEVIDTVIKACLAEKNKNAFIHLNSKVEDDYLILEIDTNALEVNIPSSDQSRLLKWNIEEPAKYISEAILNEIIEWHKGELFTSTDEQKYTVIVRLPMQFG